MDRPTQLRPALLTAPDGGLPGIPGAGPSGGTGGGIPGAGPSSAPQPAATPQFVQPSPPAEDGPVTYELSGWWRRVGAALIDGILVSIVAYALAAVLGIGTFSSNDGNASFSFQNGDFLLMSLLTALVILAYAPTMMVRTGGSTLGKLATGIRVVRADGQPLTFGFAALREVVVKGLFNLIGALTIGLVDLLNYLWPLWDGENRALHDMIVKSRVVRR